MIDPAYCRMMAAYNKWQNVSLMQAAGGLSDEERWQDQGAFFGSIARTFNHVLWDDALWLARFGGDRQPESSIEASLDEPKDWVTFENLRQKRDEEIIAWTESLAPSDLSGIVGWYPAGGDVLIEKPAALCAAHFFNHQTHHRGQIHAMLTAAGAEPDVTDLPMLPTGE